MANNNSFYIGIPCGSTETVPSYYDGPTTLIYNNGSNVESAIPYADVALNEGSGYAVHFCDASNASTGMNTAHLAYAHDYNGTQRFMITDINLLPPGTRYWVHNMDDVVNAGYYIDYSATRFGDPDDDGVYVNVELFGDVNTLYSTGSYNNWFYANGKYRFFGNSNSLWKSYEYPVQANHTYTFSLKTYSEASSDGIIISTSSLSSGSVISSGQARAYGLYGTNSTASSTWTYTPTSNGTVYFYFKTDINVLYGPGGTNGGNGVDYTYGEIEVTDSSPSVNNISYVFVDDLLQDNVLQVDCTSDAVEAFETDSIKYATISNGGATCDSGTPTCTLISVVNVIGNVSQSGWNISGTGGNVGTTIIIPNHTPSGTYECTIRVVSPTVGQKLTQTIDEHIDIYIRSNRATYGNIEDSNGGDGIVYISGYNDHNIPAGDFTLNTSNIGNYVDIDYGTVDVNEHPFTQTINYTNGTSETLNYNNSGAFTFSWVGNSTSFSTKGCVADVSNNPEDVSINTMTYRVTGSGGKTYTVGTIDTLPREANVVESSSTTTQYGIPSVTIGNGLTPGTSEAIVTCTVTNTQTTTTTYTSGCQSSSQGSTTTGTAKWAINSKTYTPTGGNAETTLRFTVTGGSYDYNIGKYIYNSGTNLSHNAMYVNEGTDTVEIIAYNMDDITKTNTATKSLVNTYTDVWGDILRSTSSVYGPTLSYYAHASACGGTVSPSVQASQTCTRTWTSGFTQEISAQLGYSYAMTSSNGFSIDTSSGVVTAEPRGKSAQSRTSNTITLTISGEDNKSATATATCTQSGNTYTDVIGDVSITEYSYANASACGETVQPTINASQTITRNWDCNAGPEEIHPTLSYSYDMITENGFSIGISTGAITVTRRGKDDTPRVSRTATVTVTGSGSKSATATATCTQNGNTYTDTWSNPSISTFSYPYISACGGTVSPTISASQTRTRTWDCNAGTNTLDVDVSNNTIYTKLSGDSGLTVDFLTGNVTGTSRGKKTSSLGIEVSVTVTANGKSSTSTANVIQEGNTYTITWGDVNITSYTYPTNPISACNNSSTGNPTVVASQKGTKVWGCNAGTDEDAVDGQLSYRYGITATSGLSINSSTGVITGTAIGKSTTPRSTTATVTVNGSGGKSATKTLTVTQNGNTYTDSWNNPVIDTFSYSTVIPAGGGSCSPTVSISQSGTRTWGCGAGTEELTNTTFNRVYGMSTPHGKWTLDTLTGAVSSIDLGTDPNGITTSPNVTITVLGMGLTSTAKAKATQEANTVTYGSVSSVNVVQTAYFPREGGTLRTTNIENYFTPSATQKKTWTSGSTEDCDITYSWSGSNKVINSLADSERNDYTERTIDFTVTANGEGGESNSTSVTSILQEKNVVVSYGDVSTVTVTQRQYYPRNGGTLSTSNIGYYFTPSATQTVTLQRGTRSGSISYSWSGTDVSIPSLNNILATDYTSRNINFRVTATGESNKTQTKNVTTILQQKNEINSYGEVSTPGVTQTTNFPANGVTLTTSNIGNYFTRSTNSSQTINLQLGSTTGDVTYSWEITSGTVASLGTTATTGVTSKVIDITYTATGEGDKSASTRITSGGQEINALTSISFVTDTKTIAYQDSTTGVVTAYYTSGSSKNVSNDTNTSYDDTSNPDRVSFTKNS